MDNGQLANFKDLVSIRIDAIPISSAHAVQPENAPSRLIRLAGKIKYD